MFPPVFVPVYLCPALLFQSNPPKTIKNDQPSVNGGHKNDIVDLKDVELTLLPSYLQETTDNENQNNSSMVELLNSSKNSHSSGTTPNQKSTSPPQRPPRLHGNQGIIIHHVLNVPGYQIYLVPISLSPIHMLLSIFQI